MADPDDEIVVKGKLKGKDIEITLKKGKKGKKRRKKDKVKIKVGDDDLTPLIEGAGENGIELEWITAEENNIGGWTGVASGFSLRVHCPPAEGAKPGDKPYVNVEIPEKTREKWKKLAQPGGELPEPPEGEIRVPITKEQQKALNDYFKDPELPKKLS